MIQESSQMGDGQNVKTLLEEVESTFSIIDSLYKYEQLKNDLKKGTYRMGYHIGQLNALGEARLRLEGIIERHGKKVEKINQVEA